MAARDVELYNYLKEALKNKLRYPEADSFKLGKYYFDYDYIFQLSRRLFPAKYNIAHSHLDGKAIAYLDKPQLEQLNFEYAKDLVEGFGGLDEKQAEAKEIDAQLADYLKPETAPEEPNTLYEELEKHELPETQQPNQGHEQVPSIENSQPEIHLPERRVVFERRPVNPQLEKTSLNTGKAESDRQELKQRMQASQNPSAQPLRRNVISRDSRRNIASANTRKKAAAVLLKPSAASTAGSGGAISNYLGARSLAQAGQWLANRLGLQGLGNLIGKFFTPEKLLGQGLRALGNLGARAISSLGRAGLQGLSSWASGARTALGIGRAGASIAQGASAIATGVGAVVTAAAFWWVIATLAIFGLFIFTWWSINQTENSNCGKPGTMELAKGVDGPTEVKVGDSINFYIRLTYRLQCDSSKLSTVVVTDKIPSGTVYDENNPTAKATTVKGDVTDGVYDKGANTITWTFKDLPVNYPFSATFSVNTVSDNVWVTNQANVTYTVSSSSLSGIGAVPNGEDAEANQDTCNGTYSLKSPRGNFGDPLCNFDKNATFTQLQQLDPENANYWFTQVIYCETGGSYDPNSFNPGSTSGKGAYGMYQMNPGGQGNGEYDTGDVAWQKQTTNALNYSNFVRNAGVNPWRYWECAKDKW